jgi:hypothetical protein
MLDEAAAREPDGASSFAADPDADPPLAASDLRDGGGMSTSTFKSTAARCSVTGFVDCTERGSSGKTSFSCGTAPGTTAEYPPLGERVGGARREAGAYERVTFESACSISSQKVPASENRSRG